VQVEEPLETPDELDLLTTSRNHDLKRGIARSASTDDWIYGAVNSWRTSLPIYPCIHKSNDPFS